MVGIIPPFAEMVIDLKMLYNLPKVIEVVNLGIQLSV
jgi:hypothetical protein